MYIFGYISKRRPYLNLYGKNKKLRPHSIYKEKKPSFKFPSFKGQLLSYLYIFIMQNWISEPCPAGYFGKPCKCFEDNVRYLGGGVANAVKSHQTSRAACRDYCRDTLDCHFWSWVKSPITFHPSVVHLTHLQLINGECTLSDARGRETFIPGQNYVSGSKQCILPEDSGKWRFHLNN